VQNSFQYEIIHFSIFSFLGSFWVHVFKTYDPHHKCVARATKITKILKEDKAEGLEVNATGKKQKRMGHSSNSRKRAQFAYSKQAGFSLGCSRRGRAFTIPNVRRQM